MREVGQIDNADHRITKKNEEIVEKQWKQRGMTR